ncbi:High-affinity proline transporter PutP [Pandoraea terrae]|uniref:High-affinity proline transporter PutP n=1 Tax=Pandoraea terrae TaxID=1537710 RepID=A0A5E4TZU4_9BURK|nr:sodium:solute symporter family protein [Pandoraea terrae]VVD92793.1 High-affinity proline transporter PutP [Pandoraea terrae]
MLIWFVILYWVISVAIGLLAAVKVRNTKDFTVAGRSLPFSMVIAVVFATWFGSEAVLGIPATFIGDGLRGVVADPFGSSMCLVLVGLFFARPLYRMNLMTIGDFYKLKYNRTVEVVTSIAIVISYLGWVGAQIKALGLVFHAVSNGAVTEPQGMMIGGISVLAYTLLGGMISVAVTDFIQMIIIVIGLVYIAFEVSGMVPGGASAVVAHAAEAGKFVFWPNANPAEILAFIAAGITMMFGSIPQQDVFQRVMSSKSEKIAMSGSVLGGCLYFVFTFIPIFLAYSALLIAPGMVQKYIGTDPQQILPQLVLTSVPIIAQVMFFGALLSAIKSCASATLLAPSVTFAENIIRPMLKGPVDDKHLLRLMRIVVLCFTALVMVYALNSTASIFHMVESAYKVTLVCCFVPLGAGLYWKRANALGGTLAVFAGLIVWIGMELLMPDAMVPPQLGGLLASIGGMVVGSLMPVGSARRSPPGNPPVSTI